MGSMSEQVSEKACWIDGQGKLAQSARERGVLGADGRDMLLETVKQAVIPRLVALPWIGRAEAKPAAVPGSAAVPVDAVAKLLELCLQPDGQGVALFVAELHRVGVGAESIYVDVLTPVARELGVMWENDDCSFADVTIAVLRLQNAQRALAPQFVAGRVAGLGAPRALLAPVPGEQHTFGLSIVMEYFLRAGWEARLGAPGTEAEVMTQVRREKTDLVGLSFACDEHVPSATALIGSLREASANPNLIIMVGGPSFVADPTLAGQIGADATALDGQQAVLRANELMHRTAGNA